MESMPADEQSVISISPAANGVFVQGDGFVSQPQSEVSGTDFDLLLFCSMPLDRSQLSVDFSSAYDRQAHPDPELEQAINKIWDQRVAAQPSLFNGTKFRVSEVGRSDLRLLAVYFPYGGFRRVQDPESKLPTKVSLCLGLTDHRTFVGTNLSSNWPAFLVPSEDDVEKCKHTADPLGNAAIVETADLQIVVLQRSADASLREVVEETGIPASSLSDPLFIGCSRRRQNVRPATFFYLKTALTSAQVLSNYQHAEHSYESTALYTLTPEELVEAAKRMPGCHRGGAALYQLLREYGSKPWLVTPP
ncbi:hypothetical protein R1sor_012146 [Riccia sorocarpa]|uniref:Nudix hydrolase domain-containing protein n=1 Tax=Riccia sorocarpa TaxID=122646 RepID=A0ABD3I2Y9_9MARC